MFVRPVEGVVKIPDGKKYGFISDAFMSPKLIEKYQLNDGNFFKGFIVKGWYKEKKRWSWQLVDMDIIDI